MEIKEGFYKILHPKLTVLVCSKWKKDNVMACAWLTPVSEEPPLLLVCIDKNSFTAKQISKTKEFTINIPDSSLRNKVLICGKKSGEKIDKAKLAGLTYADSMAVKPKIIKECIGHIECKVTKRIDGGECYVFLAKVLKSYVDEKFFEKKKLLHLSGDKFIEA